MKAFQVPRPEIPAAARQSQTREAAVKLPLGGMGAGGIGGAHLRGFGPWSLDAGERVSQSLPACQFSLFEQPLDGVPQAYALNFGGEGDPETRQLPQWTPYPTGHCTQRSLFPRSWHTYAGVFQSEIVCEQFSPFWAGCYQETSYPVGIFNWTFHNPTDQPLTLSLMLTWQNMVGWFTNVAKQTPRQDQPQYQPKWQESTGNFNQWITDHFRVGCLFNRVRLYDELQEGEGQMAIASITNPALEVYHIGRWNPESDGEEVWKWFARNGMLPDQQDETPAEPSEQVASALAIRFTVRPGRGKKIPFILAWDLPVMEFVPSGTYFQRHSDFFARTGNNAWTVVRTALKHSDVWRDKIIAWQQPLLDRADVPDWFPVVLCNGLSQLVDGGTIWTAGTETAPIGQFARLNHPGLGETNVYENLQARLLDSFALVMLFPRLDKAVLEAYTRVIIASGTVPSNLGTPRNHPWQVVDAPEADAATNAALQTSAFVVQVYRDYVLTGASDTEFLWECWPAVCVALEMGQGPASSCSLWPVVLASAIAIVQTLTECPPMNPAHEPEDYPKSIMWQGAACQSQLEQWESPLEPSPEHLLATFYARVLNLEEQLDDRLLSPASAQALATNPPGDATVSQRLLGAAYLLSQGEVETAWAIATSTLEPTPDPNQLWLYWLLQGVLTNFKTA